MTNINISREFQIDCGAPGDLGCISLVGGMTLLTCALMRCKMITLETLSSNELIGYVDLSDFYETWPICSSVINALKSSLYLRMLL